MIFTSPINFNDFTSLDRYKFLQSKFLSYDNSIFGLNEISIIKKVYIDDFKIIYLESHDNNIDYIDIYFYKDYLHPRISKLAKETINKIQKVIRKKFISDSEKIQLFFNQSLNDFYSIQSKINEADYLNLKTRKRLLNQIDIVLEFLGTEYNIGFKYTEKFKFKLNEQDLLVLFFLLRQSKLLYHPNDTSFGLLLERHFQYHSEKENAYKQIKKAGKKINDYKNGNKSINNSIKRLKAIFSDNFFQID